MICFFSEDIAFNLQSKMLFKKWLKKLAEGSGHSIGNLNYIFCSDAYLLEMNRQYLGHDYYTDIITFDYDEDDTISGDIFISIDTVRSNAEERNIPFMSELHRVIIHGILHLCGINDKGPGEREVMESSENRALALLPELGINIE